MKVTYNHLSRPVKAAFWFTACNVIRKGIAFFVTPIYVRLLTAEEYGMYAIYHSWYSIIAIFATLNLNGRSYFNGLVKYEKNWDAFTSAMQGLGTLITVSLGALFLLAGNRTRAWLNLPFVVILCMFAQCLFSPAMGFWSMRQRYEFKYKRLIAVTIIVAVMTPLCGILAIQHSARKGEAIILGTTGAQLAVCVFLYGYIFLKGRRFFDREQWRFALRFNLPLIPHYLSGMVLGQADRVMIDRMVGREAAGVYSLVYTFSAGILVISTGVFDSLTPWVYQKMKAGRYGDIKKTANHLAVFFACGFLLFIALAPEVMRIIATPRYYEAIWIIPPIVVGMYFEIYYSLFALVEFYYEKTVFVMLASIAAAVSNVLLNYIFIPVFGYLAAGYTTLACYMILAAAHYVFMRRICKQRLAGEKVYDPRVLLLTSAGLMALAAVFMALYQLPVIRYLVIALGLGAGIVKRKSIAGIVSNILLLRKNRLSGGEGEMNLS